MSKTNETFIDNIDVEIEAQCHALKLPGLYQAYLDQHRSNQFDEMDFPRRLLTILQAESTARHSKRLIRLLKESGLRDLMPSLQTIIYSKTRGISKSQITELARCQWITQTPSLNVVITGQCGCGKTWLLTALAKQALEKGIPTIYLRASQLIERLQKAREEGEPAQFRHRINAKKLIAIDDIGMTPMDESTLDDFLTLIDERMNENGAMIIASQRRLSDWHNYFGGGYHADALMDRIKNRSHIIELKGTSLRAMKK